MVFFQAALLGGYAYAHASTSWLGARRQALLHLAVLAPAARGAAARRGRAAGARRRGEPGAGRADPALGVGRPSVPRGERHRAAPAEVVHRDRTSRRARSVLPLRREQPRQHARAARLSHAHRAAAAAPGGRARSRRRGCGRSATSILAALTRAVRGDPLWTRRGAAAAAPGRADADAATDSPRGRRAPAPRDGSPWPSCRRASSSAPPPTSRPTSRPSRCLWVLPLAIYLLSFIIAFGRWPAALQRVVAAVAVPAVLVVLFLVLSSVIERIWVTVLWHLGALARGGPGLPRRGGARSAAAALPHGVLPPALRGRRPRRALQRAGRAARLQLAGRVPAGHGARRHAAERAPMAERPAARCLASRRRSRSAPACSPSSCTRIPSAHGSTSPSVPRVFHLPFAWAHDHLDPIERLANRMLTYGPPLLIAFLLRRRPWALGGALAAVLLVAGFVDARNSEQIRQSRSFFGVLRIMRDRDEKGFTSLRHGTTLHGQQSLEPVRRGEPLTYYHRQGPIGQLFAELDQRAGSLRIAVIGLGTGTLAAYARPGDAVTFYEIDRLVRDVAFDRSYFIYVADALDRGATGARGAGRRPHPPRRHPARAPGRALRPDRRRRVQLGRHPRPSADARGPAPVSRDARRRDGIIAVHISNRYLDLEPVVANLAEDAGLQGRLIEHDDSPETAGAARSTWVLLSPTAEAMGNLPTYPAGWRRGSRPCRRSGCGPTTSTTCSPSSDGETAPARAKNFPRRIQTRRPHDAAAGMGGGAAEVEAAHRRAIAGVPGDGAEREELARDHRALEDVAARSG